VHSKYPALQVSAQTPPVWHANAPLAALGQGVQEAPHEVTESAKQPGLPGQTWVLATQVQTSFEQVSFVPQVTAHDKLVLSALQTYLAH